MTARAEERQGRLDFEAPLRRRRASRPESFHVRSAPHLTAEELAEGQAQAARQERDILRFFRERARTRFTPAEVGAHFPAWPLTSIRRALTDLTKRGLLVHHRHDRRPGPYGKPNSTWSLAC